MSELPTVRAMLEREGLWADKRLGQHFLLDLNITRRIARLAAFAPGATVIEVGPGPGGLTRALLEAGAGRVIAIEKDERFLPILRDIAAWSDGRLEIVHADALAVDEAGLVGSGEAAIVSNLPYNVGTPLLVKWLRAGPWRGPMTRMFQKAVAERSAASPGTSAYGRLAVAAQAVCAAQVVMNVPASAFTPPPKIDSAVVRLVDRPDRFDDLDALETVTAAAFGQRRKMLRSALASLGGAEDLLAAVGIAPTARAETIPVAGFLEMARAWRARRLKCLP
jgi:16S rRNA (adenine1518-N6/adenine1519-N6)-dimethyltransferase